MRCTVCRASGGGGSNVAVEDKGRESGGRHPLLFFVQTERSWSPPTHPLGLQGHLMKFGLVNCSHTYWLRIRIAWLVKLIITILPACTCTCMWLYLYPVYIHIYLFIPCWVDVVRILHKSKSMWWQCGHQHGKRLLYDIVWV